MRHFSQVIILSFLEEIGLAFLMRSFKFQDEYSEEEKIF